MNPLEQQLGYPFGDVLPAPGTSLEVAPGVRWLRMALPFQLNHINLWLLRDEQDGIPGWTIVDCGIDNPSTRTAWETVFANGLEGLPILRVVATHMHPDHMGLSHWLTDRWTSDSRECRLWMSATEYNTARLASASITSIGGAETARFMASHGLTDPQSQEKIRARANYYASMVPNVPTRFRRLLDGMSLDIAERQWTCHAGYGHSPEHMSLYGASAGVLISGDMVLPRISTNVSVHEFEPESDPLNLYLSSIARMKSLPESTLLLPSHGRPFTGLHTRVDQLCAHHAERLSETLAACAQAPTSASDLLMTLFKRKLDLHQTTFAMGESIAHLHALWHTGQLVRTISPQGIYLFSAN